MLNLWESNRLWILQTNSVHWFLLNAFSPTDRFHKTSSTRSTPCPHESGGTGRNLIRANEKAMLKWTEIRWHEARFQWGYPDGWNQYWQTREGHKWPSEAITSLTVVVLLLHVKTNCNCQCLDLDPRKCPVCTKPGLKCHCIILTQKLTQT